MCVNIHQHYMPLPIFINIPQYYQSNLEMYYCLSFHSGSLNLNIDFWYSYCDSGWLLVTEPGTGLPSSSLPVTVTR